MFRMRPVVLFFAMVVSVRANTVTYEGDEFPEKVGWERIVFTDIDRSLDSGWFVHFVDFANEIDAYQLLLADFASEQAWFVEWRVETDAPSSILDSSGTPVVVSAGGTAAANYHFTITDARVQVWRSNFLPIVFVDIEPGVPHTYRLELHGVDSYAWFIDGQLGDSGPPEGQYPNDDSVLIWATSREEFDTTTRWDYVRFGVIPQDASGDFDSDGAVTPNDYRFFQDCLTNVRPGINGGPGNDAGLGCLFADFDLDDDVDLRDFADFQVAFTGVE